MPYKSIPCTATADDDDDAYCEHCENGHDADVHEDGSVVHEILVLSAPIAPPSWDSPVQAKKKKKYPSQSGLVGMIATMDHPPVKPRFKSIRKPRPIP